VCHKIFNTSKRMRKHLFNAHKESAEEFRSTWKLAEPFTTVAIKI
jgi:predicted transcriptional regulator